LLAIALGLLGFGTLLGIDLFGGFLAIAGITLVFVVACVFLADAIVGLAVGRLVAERVRAQATAPSGQSESGRDRWADLGPLVLGVAIVVVLTSIPILGGLVKLLV